MEACLRLGLEAGAFKVSEGQLPLTPLSPTGHLPVMWCCWTQPVGLSPGKGFLQFRLDSGLGMPGPMGTSWAPGSVSPRLAALTAMEIVGKTAGWGGHWAE